jgi:hypothetical protein
VVHPASSYRQGHEGATTGTHAASIVATSPDEGVTMGVPVRVAASIAWQTSSHVANRRPLRARERRIFHHGSIRLREAAYQGWKTNSQRGWASAQSSTAGARWADRLSRTAWTRPTAGDQELRRLVHGGI